MPSSRSKPAASVRGKPRSAHTVRIIGGQWKRTPITVVDAEGLRPTPDRVRETLFNWLTHQAGGDLTGRSVLDLFAGSGALGFEAASRQAGRVVLVETDPKAVAALFGLKARLKAERVEVKAQDARDALRRYASSGERFDIILLDPPFREGWLLQVLALATRVLAPGGLIYVECEAPLDAGQRDALGLELLRKDKAGQVFYHLLRLNTDQQTGETTPC